jgi:hypothetical protein
MNTTENEDREVADFKRHIRHPLAWPIARVISWLRARHERRVDARAEELAFGAANLTRADRLRARARVVT